MPVRALCGVAGRGRQGGLEIGERELDSGPGSWKREAKCQSVGGARLAEVGVI